MKDKLCKIFSFVFYALSLFILLFCIKVRTISDVYIYREFRLLLLFICCVFIYLAGYLLVKELGYSKKILKVNLIIYFIIYTITIVTLTLFDEIFGRNGFVLIDWNRELFDSYMKYSFNIIPFSTIKLYINGYMNNIVSFDNFAINIFGNLFAFMPYGVFIPLIFKKVNKYKKFLLLMILIVVIIEGLQFSTLSGSCDIDDLILNVLGASVIYLIFNFKVVKNVIKKIFLFE